jgi:hypothetical protein
VIIEDEEEEDRTNRYGKRIKLKTLGHIHEEFLMSDLDTTQHSRITCKPLKMPQY